MCACAISAECAARCGNFEIAKEPELISQQRKVIFKKQVYHSDQYKNWTSMMFCGIFQKKFCTPLSSIYTCTCTYTRQQELHHNDILLCLNIQVGEEVQGVAEENIYFVDT